MRESEVYGNRSLIEYGPLLSLIVLLGNYGPDRRATLIGGTFLVFFEG